MIANVNLLRSNWYGNTLVANGSSTGTRAKANANAKWYCLNWGTYDYRGESYHRVTIGATNYVGYTANTGRFAC